MKKIVRLTESDMARLVNKVVKEQNTKGTVDSKHLVSEMDDNFGKFDLKKNALAMYREYRRKLDQAINLLEESAKKGEDTSHYRMVIRLALREMDSSVEDLMK